MKKVILRRVAFIGKSMLWSLALYVLVMTVSNWDEIRNNMHSSNTVVIEQMDQQSTLARTADVSQHGTAIRSVMMLVKTICGIASLGK